LRRHGSEEQFFAELAFCLFTPQSGALRCWAAVKRLHERGLLFGGTAERIAVELTGVRFHHTKARRLVMARRQFTRDGRLCLKAAVTRSGRTVSDTRDWLVQNVIGFGYKEASHFLRNVGYYRDVAILDRHILRNLQALDVIDTIPDTLPRNTYCTIERKMKRLARDTGIPASHLDLVFWCRATGEIFK
jgi:N-glycosylase/DNA lyase